MLSTAELLKEASHASGADFREDYSGRGMFGKSCVGIVGGNILEIVHEIVLCVSGEVSNLEEFQDEIGEILEELTNYREDSMGLDKIIYWPSIQFEEK